MPLGNEGTVCNGQVRSPRAFVRFHSSGAVEATSQQQPQGAPEPVAADITTSSEVTTVEVASDESISGVLRYCKRILYSYLRLLGVMGLKPFNRDSPECHLGACMNKVYILLVALILLLGYVLQFLTCFRRDIGFAYKNESTRVLLGAEDWTVCHGNSVYIHIPNGLHFISFLYMVYLYRDNEQLENLMERVFIQAAHAQTSFFSQKKLIRNLQFLVVLSVTWLVFSCACQLLQTISHIDNIQINFWPAVPEEVKRGLVVFMAFSTAWQDAIQVTVIVSYCVHCYLLATYLNLLHVRVQLAGLALRECIKEIGELGKILNYLNDDLSKGIAPLLLCNGAIAFSGTTFLIGSHHKARNIFIWDNLAVGFTTFLWVVIFVFPLTQAAKLATSCSRLQTLGNTVCMRPFGYQNHTQEDLDSFLLFVSTLKMRVCIIRVPISTSILASIACAAFLGLMTWGLIML